MRILHLITTLDPGGAENHLLLLCRELQRRGCQQHIAWLKGAGGLTGEFEALGLPTSRVRLLGAADPTMPRRIRVLVDREHPDVLHTHLFKADFYGAWAAARRPRLVLVSSKHNQDPELAAPLFGGLGRGALRRADRVIAISDAVRQHVADHGGAVDARLSRIYYGFDVDAFDQRAGSLDLRASLGIPPATPLAIFLGRLTPQKGLDTLLEAWRTVHRDLPAAQLALVGQGLLESELRQQAVALGIDDVVSFAGFQSEIRAVLEAGDLLVLPSRWEGFGLVLAEAMAASRPVVGSDAGSIPEVVEDGVTGLLSSAGDAAALATNLLELLRDPARARRMGEAGRHRVECEFGVERMVDETLAIYEEARAHRVAACPAERPW